MTNHSLNIEFSVVPNTREANLLIILIEILFLGEPGKSKGFYGNENCQLEGCNEPYPLKCKKNSNKLIKKKKLSNKGRPTSNILMLKLCFYVKKRKRTATT